MLGDLGLVELLLEHGADADATDHVGRSALLYATLFRFAAIEERLLAAGADRCPAEVAHRRLRSYVGRYGDRDRLLYQIVADPGRSSWSSPAPPVCCSRRAGAAVRHTFYRSNDPGAIIFEVRLEGRVTGSAHTEYSGWATFPKLEDGPS